MATGPPPDAAESSRSHMLPPSSNAPPPATVPMTQLQYQTTTPYAPSPALLPGRNQSYYGYNAWQSGWSSYPYVGAPGTGYPANYSMMPYQHTIPKQESIENKIPSKSSAPRPPTPPPEPYLHWDEILKTFFSAAGLTQTLRAFEMDMFVLNPEFEKNKIQPALKSLIEKLSKARELNEDADMVEGSSSRPLEERKLDYVHLPSGANPQPPTSINKAISTFLADKKARNSASNRAEFLHSLEERRRKVVEESGLDAQAISSCARTDAKPIDRDTQMKYDIAKNEEGPLKRTMKTNESKSALNAPEKHEVAVEQPSDETVTASQVPAINERLGNIESHFAVRYVPSTPRTLFARLKFLEDHIIKLEKEYPPWAALHFNQPSRGWPPPPRQTPVIVPPHLRAADKDVPLPASAQTSVMVQQPAPGTKETKKKSSLHKAVMEKLEVQQAMNELSGARAGSTS